MSRSILIRDMEERDLIRMGWRVSCPFWGRVGERRGVIVGFAAAFWADDEEPIITFDARSSASRPWWLAIEAKKFMRDAPFERCVAHCNHDIPRAQEFLVFLGFQPTEQVISNSRVWLWTRGGKEKAA